LSKTDRGAKKREAKELKSKAVVEFGIAGEMFAKIGSHRQAAQCLYTAEKYAEAAELFIKCGQYTQAAECYRIIHNYEKAAKMFEESKLILKALECYENLCNWEAILLCLNRNKDLFKDIERESLIRKYVPLALSSIFKLIDTDNNEENKTKELEQKYAKHADKIEEVDEKSDIESDGESDEANPFDDDSKVQDASLNLGDTPSNSLQVEKQANGDSDEEQIVTSNKDQKLNDTSFSVISKAEFDDNFEHLSNFDPDDEFVNSNRSYSVIGSVISNNKESLASYSDFSIVGESRASSILNANTIQTNRDIYIEDIAMQKIIYYISLFSEETKSYLLKLRSKDKLVQEQTEELSIDAFELELDNIDVDFVKTLLDVLENFDMFRLCMIVCNRYNVTDQLSRYLTSACYKYSNLKLLTTKQILEINNPMFRQKQKQVSVLANEAIHNMFALVSPDMIKQVKTEDMQDIHDKSKAEHWRFLFYLGFWRKLVYIMDSLSSLKLCYSIGDLMNFKVVYMINYRSDLSDDQIKDLVADTSGNWIDPTDRSDCFSTRGILCQKVLMED